jgi:hypothetical protein
MSQLSFCPTNSPECELVYQYYFILVISMVVIAFIILEIYSSEINRREKIILSILILLVIIFIIILMNYSSVYSSYSLVRKIIISLILITMYVYIVGEFDDWIKKDKVTKGIKRWMKKHSLFVVVIVGIIILSSEVLCLYLIY